MSFRSSDVFMYSGFKVTQEFLEHKLAQLKRMNRSLWRRRIMAKEFGSGIVKSMIACIADGNFRFLNNADKDAEVCNLVKELIIQGGYNGRGEYTETAHRAMRQLCDRIGEKPENENNILYDKTIKGGFSKLKAKMKGWFGFGAKKAEDKPMSQPQPKAEPVSQPEAKPVAKTATHTARHTSHKEKSSKSRLMDKWCDWRYRMKSGVDPVYYKLTVAGLGLAAIGVATIVLADYAEEPDYMNYENYAPTFRETSVPNASHRTVEVYDISDTTRAAQGFSRDTAVVNPSTSQIEQPVVKVAPRATQTAAPQAARAAAPRATQAAASQVSPDSVSAQITRASKSSLNILLGQAKADSLCRQIQRKIDAGIFAAPQGMSVERIAHAMTMSRVYEGRSVILDALRSDVALTPAQQAAFNQHILDIGDLGVKLQRRMASKHNLPKYSRFDHASKAQQKVHIKNVRQLRQLRNQMARGR